jgi:Cof subfamily protein (haloacid dehalogenase superfamily)
MTMTKKLIFFDIDGTLMDFNKKIPDSTKNAIQRLKEKGHDVAIATGRAPFLIGDVCEQLDIHTYVSFNGQYVVHEGKAVYENPIPVETLQRIESFALKRNHPLVFMGDKDMKANVKNHPYIEQGIGSLKVNQPGFQTDYYRETTIYQALLFCKTGEEENYRHFEDVRILRWHDLATDVMPVMGSKAEGIKRLLDYLHYTQSDVIAFGDGLNDVEMIRFAGTGVAMGNAEQVLKNVADFVTKSVDKDGIDFAVKALELV